MIRYFRIAFVSAIFLVVTLGSLAFAGERGVAQSPTSVCPILVGSPLPSITLTTLDGKSFDLNKAVAEKPTILIYFRGGW